MAHQSFFITGKSGIQRICFDEIIYIESDRNYSKVVTTKNTFVVCKAICQLHKMIPADIFHRVHKSYIISVNHISFFQKGFVMLGTREIPIGVRYFKQFINSIPYLK